LPQPSATALSTLSLHDALPILSITSKWMRSAPALTTASTSAPSRAKSADRIEGAIHAGIMGMLLQPVSRARASRYLSLVRAMVSGGTVGAGDCLLLERISRESRTHCLTNHVERQSAALAAIYHNGAHAGAACVL